MLVRDATAADAAAILEIYNPYVLGDICTFELHQLSADDMVKRIADKQSRWGFLVGEDEQRQLLGFGYYGPFRDRAAYDHVVETSIYLSAAHRRRGLGPALYQAVIDHATNRGYREAIAVLAIPNAASQALHRKMGFTHCGTLSRSGYKLGRYIDTAYYQRPLQSIDFSAVD